MHLDMPDAGSQCVNKGKGQIAEEDDDKDARMVIILTMRKRKMWRKMWRKWIRKRKIKIMMKGMMMMNIKHQHWNLQNINHQGR